MEYFVRELVEENMKIKSTCATCGLVITAAVSEGLIQMEQRHIAMCSAAKKHSAAKVTLRSAKIEGERRVRR